MENKVRYVNLKNVPNEIIMGVFSKVRGGCSGVDELLGGAKFLLTEFKLIANPHCIAIINEKKQEITNQAASEIYELGKKYSVITQEYINQHKNIIDSAKFKIGQLDKHYDTHIMFYEQINDTLKREDWLNAKKPLVFKGEDESVIVNNGNAVYVAHKNIFNKLNVLYSESSHKEIVDNFIDEIYATSETFTGNETINE